MAEYNSSDGHPLHPPRRAGLRTEHPATIRLTERGQTQAALTAKTLPSPALVVTSPYLRTKQTAAPFLWRFLNAPQAEWPVQEFTFLNPLTDKV